MTVLTDPWVQVDRRKDPGSRYPFTLHITNVKQRDHAHCGADLRRATAVTAEGMQEGRLCWHCERAAMKAR